jgi:RNA polymerase primary sigma factor
MTALREERDRLSARGAEHEQLARVDRMLGEVRRRFVCANLRLVVKIAGQYADGVLPLGDLIQEGNIGLMIAVDKFDHTRGVRFCTYASWWIRHRISRLIANHGRAVRVPNHIAQASAKLRRSRHRLEVQRGGTATLEESAAAAGMDPRAALIAMQTTNHGLSLDAPLGDDDRTLADTLADQRKRSDDELVEDEARAVLMRTLETLRPIEADILRKRFELDGEELTLRELGDRYALSRERVRQLQNGALAKMRKQLASDVA